MTGNKCGLVAPKQRMDEILKLIWPAEMHAILKSLSPPIVSKPFLLCVLPNCKRKFLDLDRVKKHIAVQHSKLELEILHEIMTCPERNRLKVRWIGAAHLVPIFPPPIPMLLCQHHSPPHRKCPICTNVVESLGPLPPMKFFKEVIIEDTKKEQLAMIHLTLQHREECIEIIHKDEKLSRCAELQALCHDSLGRHYAGVHFFCQMKPVDLFPPGQQDANSEVRSYQRDELYMQSSLSWVELHRVRGVCYVLCCKEGQFEKRKQRVHSFRPHALVQYCTRIFDEEKKVFVKRKVNI